MKVSTVSPRRAGFTLIELMITVAVVAILAAIAYPSYEQYIRKGKRATAQGALMDLASKQQNHLLDRRTYLASGTEAGLGTLGFSKPSEIQNDYTFSCPPANCTSTAFTVQAVPSAALAAKGEQTLTIDQTGVKSPVQSGYWGK